MSLRLLVLDAYDDVGRSALAAAGATKAGELYLRMLRQLEPRAHIDVVAHEGDGFALPAAITSYDGVAWTGSNLTVYRETAAVRGHVELARAVLSVGVPCFGSCWALHVAVTAGGGRCEANPRGREFGVARGIAVTAAGVEHPMFEGKPRAFEGLTSHEDHAVALGPTTRLLASNGFSRVQAVVVEHGSGQFWATQYHAEYDLADIARLCVVRAGQLIEQGTFRDADDAGEYVRQVETLHVARGRADLQAHLGIGSDILDSSVRTAEPRNWLDRMVKRRRAELA